MPIEPWIKPNQTAAGEVYNGVYMKNGERIYPVSGTIYVKNNPNKFKPLEGNIFYTTEEPLDPDTKYAHDTISKIMVYRKKDNKGIATLSFNDDRLRKYLSAPNNNNTMQANNNMKDFNQLVEKRTDFLKKGGKVKATSSDKMHKCCGGKKIFGAGMLKKNS